MTLRFRRILAIAPLLLWFGLLMPAHGHDVSNHAGEHHDNPSAAHVDAAGERHDDGHDDGHGDRHGDGHGHGHERDDQEHAPASSHADSSCEVCLFASQLLSVMPAPIAVHGVAATEQRLVSPAQAVSSKPFPGLHLGRAPPLA